MIKLDNPTTTTFQDSSTTTSPAIVVKAKLLTLLGYCTITKAKAALFIFYRIYAVPLPLIVIFRGVYTSILS